jgi:4-hydroxy-3-polyprenylbenzoate decarboxylase
LHVAIRGEALMRIAIAITGASGAAYGVRVLEILQTMPDVETHLVVSRSAALTLKQECGLGIPEVHAMADVVHKPSEVGATIASGSFHLDAMLVAPCSIKTLSAIATCHTDDLISRAADVCLKEGRPLVLLVRETPLHVGHLRIMTAAAEAGAIIAPPVPALHALPRSVDDLIDYTVRRTLARIGVAEAAPDEWPGLSAVGADAPPDRRRRASGVD